MQWLLGSIVVVALFSCIEPDICHAWADEDSVGHSRKLQDTSNAEKDEQRVPAARDYPNGAKELPGSFTDYHHLRITWGDPSHYMIGENIGHGTYANVYTGYVKGNRSQHVVIKHLKHASWYRIKREVAVMQAVRNGPPFIVRLLEVIPHLHEHRHHRMLTDDSGTSSSGGISSSGISSISSSSSSSGGISSSGCISKRVLPSSIKSRRLLNVPSNPVHTAARLLNVPSNPVHTAARLLNVPSNPVHTAAPNMLAFLDAEEQGGLDLDRADISGGGVDDGTDTSDSFGYGLQPAASSDERWVTTRRRGLRSTAKEDAATEKDLQEKVQVLKDSKAISQFAYADPKRPASLVIEAVPFTPYEMLVDMVSLNDVRRYTRQLVEALEFAHSRGIMHRDVKSSNTFIDHGRKRLVLGDWGLAEFYFPKQTYKYSVCTRAYKAPELLLKYTLYNYAIDMWGVGMHVGSFVFRKKQIFGWAEDESGMLANIAGVLGTQGLEDLINKYSTRKPVPPVPRYRRRKWLDHFKLASPKLVTPDALDFIDKLLRYDPEERLTASEALQHPFLRGVSV